MAWKQGPMPKDTWGWGAVVPADMKGGGFYFADFHGDHALLFPSDGPTPRKITAEEVGWYDNSLTLPPDGSKSRTSE